MIKLIALNLLPYREIERARKEKEFNRMMAIAAVLGVASALAVYLFLSQLIGNQEDRNRLLQTNIDQLDAQIKEVATLKQQKQAFLARKQKIEELQNERYKAAMILNDLNILMPEGTYLISIQGDAKGSYTLVGRAISDNKVADFMRSLPSTGLFNAPKLVGIRTNSGAQEFTLTADLVNHIKEGDQK